MHTTRLPLEDGVSDVLKKAARWLAPDNQAFASNLGISVEELESIYAYSTLSEKLQIAVANQLNLDRYALLNLANNAYLPDIDGPPQGFLMITTPYGDMSVNAFVIWNPTVKRAVLFDTGGDCAPLVQAVKDQGLTVEAIFLTHAHGDHVAEMERLLEKLASPSPIPIYVAQAEESVVNQLGVPNVKSFTSPTSFSLAGLDVEARDVSGHSPGLTNFAIHGLDRPLSIVGDAIFAGSIGGVKADYLGTLDRIRRNILSDQLNTVLACGHGPLTTVGLELKNNPFFAKTPGV